MKKTLKFSVGRRPFIEKKYLISLICLFESLEVHTQNLSFLSGLIKKLAMKTTLKMAFGRRPSTFYSNITKRTCLRMMQAKCEKHLIKTGGVIHIWKSPFKVDGRRE